MTGVILVFHLGEVLFKSGVAFKRIRYLERGAKATRTQKSYLYKILSSLPEHSLRPFSEAASRISSVGNDHLEAVQNGVSLGR